MVSTRSSHTGGNLFLLLVKAFNVKAKKLKKEVTKRPQEYIKHRTLAIASGLTNKHPEVRSHLAFGEDGIGYTAKILAIIEWVTQQWKLGKPNPVLIVPSWLRTMEALPTTTPVRGEPVRVFVSTALPLGPGCVSCYSFGKITRPSTCLVVRF